MLDQVSRAMRSVEVLLSAMHGNGHLPSSTTHSSNSQIHADL